MLLKVTPMWAGMQTVDRVVGIRAARSDIANYEAFKSLFGREGMDEQCLLGKYYLAQTFLEHGCISLYLDATYQFGRPSKKMKVDVYGRCDSETLIGLCPNEAAAGQLYRRLALLSSAPVKVILMLPFTEPLGELRGRFSEEFIAGKFTAKFIPNTDDNMTGLFREALEMASLLTNRTRMQMLLPLLTEPTKKSHYRVRINPKLVYENLSILTSRGLVREMEENRYALTHIGNRVLIEYLTFLQKMREALESEQ
jgi:hypothetical protein